MRSTAKRPDERKKYAKRGKKKIVKIANDDERIARERVRVQPQNNSAKVQHQRLFAKNQKQFPCGTLEQQAEWERTLCTQIRLWNFQRFFF